MLTLTLMPKKRRPKFARRPKTYSEKLTETETRVFTFYKTLKDSDGKFSRSAKTLAEELGVSPKTIRRVNQHLKEIGLLSWKSGHGNGKGRPCLANRYWLIPRAITKQIREATGKCDHLGL